jgi:hypothetical protein
MTKKVMRNGIEFFMKELKNRNINHHSSSSHHSSIQNHIDNNSNKKKDSMILTLQSVMVHLEAMIDIHKVGRKIIN